jgi:hypothetical protein
MSDQYPEYQRPERKKFQMSFFFDAARAIMYLSIAIFLFTSNNFDGYLGHSFIVGFAAVSGIYGLFRLIRALITIGVIKIR